MTELSSRDVLDTFMVNTIAPIILTKELLRGMVERNSGHVVQISSASGLVGVPKLSDYTASKAAILSFDPGVIDSLRSSPRSSFTLSINFIQYNQKISIRF